MRDPYDTGSLSFVVVVVAAIALFKALSWIGVVSRRNVDSVSRWTAGFVGLAYAGMIEFSRSFGPLLDFAIRLGAGGMVASVVFGCLLIAAGTLADD